MPSELNTPINIHRKKAIVLNAAVQKQWEKLEEERQQAEPAAQSESKKK